MDPIRPEDLMDSEPPPAPDKDQDSRPTMAGEAASSEDRPTVTGEAADSGGDDFDGETLAWSQGSAEHDELLATLREQDEPASSADAAAPASSPSEPVAPAPAPSAQVAPPPSTPYAAPAASSPLAAPPASTPYAAPAASSPYAAPAPSGPNAALSPVEMPADVDGVPVPVVIGRYAVFDEIAAGGMATVHLARLIGPVGFSRTVAIKKLHPQLAADADFVEDFINEARLVSRIQHPNVATTLDVAATENEAFLVMEYVHGEILDGLLKSTVSAGKIPSPGVIVNIAAGMLHGLHAAHEAKSEHRVPLNIVHRDISPQNILVGVDGATRVIDFGVAQVGSAADEGGNTQGKLSYMSPEQLNGDEIDRRSDIFAAGIVTWESLSGRRLYAGDNAGQILAQILTREPEPLKDIVEGIPDALSDAVAKALKGTPEERFDTAREFAIAIEESMQLAPSHEVGTWVEEAAGQALADRAARVALLESVPTDLDSVQQLALPGLKNSEGHPVLPSAPPPSMATPHAASVTVPDVNVGKSASNGVMGAALFAAAMALLVGGGGYWVSQMNQPAVPGVGAAAGGPVSATNTIKPPATAEPMAEGESAETFDNEDKAEVTEVKAEEPTSEEPISDEEAKAVEEAVAEVAAAEAAKKRSQLRKYKKWRAKKAASRTSTKKKTKTSKKSADCAIPWRIGKDGIRRAKVECL